jgi:hypothetical protein
MGRVTLRPMARRRESAFSALHNADDFAGQRWSRGRIVLLITACLVICDLYVHMHAIRVLSAPDVLLCCARALLTTCWDAGSLANIARAEGGDWLCGPYPTLSCILPHTTQPPAPIPLYPAANDSEMRTQSARGAAAGSRPTRTSESCDLPAAAAARPTRISSAGVCATAEIT